MYSLLENCCNLTEKSMKRRSETKCECLSLQVLYRLSLSVGKNIIHLTGYTDQRPSAPTVLQTFSSAASLVSLAVQLPWTAVKPARPDCVSASLVPPPCFFPSGQKQNSPRAATLFPRRDRGHGIHHWL